MLSFLRSAKLCFHSRNLQEYTFRKIISCKESQHFPCPNINNFSSRNTRYCKESGNSLQILARRIHSIYKDLQGIAFTRFCIPCQIEQWSLGMRLERYSIWKDSITLGSCLSITFRRTGRYLWLENSSTSELHSRKLFHNKIDENT